MKKQLTIGFITSVSGRWPRELPQSRKKEYGAWLRENLEDTRIVEFGELVDSPQRTAEAAVALREAGVDLVVMVYGAFSGDDICTRISEELKAPVILWAPYEPPFTGGRLISNALVAVTMNAASMHRLAQKYHVVYGSLDDEAAANEVRSLIRAYSVIRQLRGTLFGLFGYRPTAFYNSAFDEGLIRRTFGIRFEETSLKTVFDRMQSLPENEILDDMQKMTDRYDVSALPEGHLHNHSALFLALSQIFEEQGYRCAAMKCWPEMGALHTTPCAVLGRLSDNDIHISCEGDVDAGITMLVQNMLTGLPCFVTDMIDIDQKENTMLFWHCGNAAESLSDEKKCTELRNHPLAGQGTAFCAALKSGEVTAARFCNIGGVYKLFLLSGAAVDTELVTPGSIVKVKVDIPVREAVSRIFEEGIPHHYSLVWKNVAQEMKLIAKIMGLEVIEL